MIWIFLLLIALKSAGQDKENREYFTTTLTGYWAVRPLSWSHDSTGRETLSISETETGPLLESTSKDRKKAFCHADREIDNRRHGQSWLNLKIFGFYHEIEAIIGKVNVDDPLRLENSEFFTIRLFKPFHGRNGLGFRFWNGYIFTHI